MTASMIRDRIQKNEEKIQKKQATIVKKQKAIEKKIAELQKKFGYEYTVRENCTVLTAKGFTDEQANEIYWAECNIEMLKEDLERLPKEIEDIRKTIESHKEQLEKEEKRTSLFLNEVPDSMKRLEEYLVDTWNLWDIERRGKLNAEYREIGYKEFFQFGKHNSADYELMHMTDEEIEKENRRLARNETIDLYNRVKEITGEVTDWKGIRLERGNQCPVLTGAVIGKQGRAYVESIVAGGWNIQKLHIRTLVHEI